jgi:peptidoglycan/xylan/chitin deacetylase (PgdA/CDA1 family)
VAEVAPYSPVSDVRAVPTGAEWEGNYRDAVSGAMGTVTRASAKTVVARGVVRDVGAGYLALRPFSDSRFGANGYMAVIEESRRNAFIRSFISSATDLAAWTADAGLFADVRKIPHGFYNQSCGVTLTASGGTKAIWQTVGTLTAVKNAVTAFVWKPSGGVVSSDDMQMCAAAGAGTPVATLLTTTFTLVRGMTVDGSQVYRATATYTGTAAAWTSGIAVKTSICADLFQNEAGLWRSSYIATTTAAVTRAADSVSVPTTGWNRADYTILAVADYYDAMSTSTQFLYQWDDGDDSDRIYSYSVNTAHEVVCGVISASAAKEATSAAYAGPSFVGGHRHTTNGAIAPFVDGVAGTPSASATDARTLSASCFIGSKRGALSFYNGGIHRLVVYSSALTNGEVATVSAEVIQGVATGLTVTSVPVGAVARIYGLPTGSKLYESAPSVNGTVVVPITAPTAGFLSFTLPHSDMGSGVNGTVTTFNVGDTVSHETIRTAPTSGWVSVDHDGCYVSVHSAARPILNEFGVKAMLGVTTTRPDSDFLESVNEAEMSWAELREMHEEGHIICSHSRTHPNLTALSEASLESEIGGSKADLVAQGFPHVDYFIAPFGLTNDLVRTVTKRHYRMLREYASGQNAAVFVDNDRLKVILTHVNISDATVTAALDAGVAAGAWVILVYHYVGNYPASEIYNVPEARYRAQIAHAVSRGARVLTEPPMVKWTTREL